MLLFNNKNLISRQTRLLSKITPSISVRFSKNTAKNALKNIGNSSSKTAHHTFTQAKVLVKPTTYTGTKVFRYPTLIRKNRKFVLKFLKKRLRIISLMRRQRQKKLTY